MHPILSCTQHRAAHSRSLNAGWGRGHGELWGEAFFGVFDVRMVRIYYMIGASLEVLGSTGDGREN